MLARALENQAAVTAVLAEGSHATAARGWALHRARRGGGTPGDYGNTATVRMAPPGTGPGLARPVRRRLWRMTRRTRAAPPGGHGGALSRVLEEARHVRGVRTGWRFLCWFAGAVRWRLRERGGGAAHRSGTPGSVALGIEIAALGPRARSVFAASPRAVHGLGSPTAGRHIDAALADTPLEAAEAAAAGVPVALLAGDPDRGALPFLAVPAFDPGHWNPIGWTPNVEDSYGPSMSSARFIQLFGMRILHCSCFGPVTQSRATRRCTGGRAKGTPAGIVRSGSDHGDDDFAYSTRMSSFEDLNIGRERCHRPRGTACRPMFPCTR